MFCEYHRESHAVRLLVPPSFFHWLVPNPTFGQRALIQGVTLIRGGRLARVGRACFVTVSVGRAQKNVVGHTVYYNYDSYIYIYIMWRPY